MRYRQPSLILGAALFLTACNPGARPTEAPAKPAVTPAMAIEAVTKAKEARRAALSAGNLEDYLSVYMDDAVLVPPYSGEIVGKELVRVRLKQVLEQVTVEANTLSDEIDVLADNIALDRGRYASSTAVKSTGVNRPDGGNYMIIWKRNDEGEWKIAYEMWTSKSPLVGDAN